MEKAMPQKISTPPLQDLLRSIAHEIGMYAATLPPGLAHTKNDPAAFDNARRTIEQLVTQAEAGAQQIKSDSLRKNIRLVLLKVRQVLLENQQQWSWTPDGQRGRSNDELMQNRPTFKIADEVTSTDLHELANLIEVEQKDASTCSDLAKAEWADLAGIDRSNVPDNVPLNQQTALDHRHGRRNQKNAANAAKATEKRRLANGANKARQAEKRLPRYQCSGPLHHPMGVDEEHCRSCRAASERVTGPAGANVVRTLRS
jgi:hypothetical protein